MLKQPVFLDPTNCGWQRVNNCLEPVWYEGSNLPTDEEYNDHISSKNSINNDIDDEIFNTDSSDEETADECPLSDVDLSSDDEWLCST
jgi:hypothetical protein